MTVPADDPNDDLSAVVDVRVTGPAEAPDVVTTLVADEVASRLAAKDATLWGPEAEDEAAKRLGWVDLAITSRRLLPEIADLVAGAQADGLDRVVLCGMGGSSLAPEVITAAAGRDLVVLDSTDPDVVAPVVAADLDRTIVVVASKSGSTVETDSQRRAFLAAFAAAGIDGASRIVVVTDPGSPLEQLARDEGYRAVVLADPDVGGRYSALTAFGLVPSALAGADISALLDQAAMVAPDLAIDDVTNPALVLGAALAGSDPLRDKTAIFEEASDLPGFGDWAEQLIAESTGKRGVGVLPVVVDSDAPEVRWPAPDVLVAAVAAEGAHLATDAAHVGVAGTLGAQILLWETATAVAGRLLGINPFDQPDVESAKTATRGLLEATPEPEPPLFVDDGIEVRGDPGLFGPTSDIAAADVAAAVAVLLDQVPERGYVAVMAYLDRHRDAELASTRTALALRTQRPVTFGWGPRFLHSTGQFHKGGPPVGVFLQITGASASDLPVPDRPYTFGELIAAQAAGDAKVLAELGRPVLRLHLTDRAAGVARLLEMLR
jgi:glucose-6-phosphate isomerase